MNIQTEYSQIHGLLSLSKSKREFERILCVWLKMALSLSSKQIAIAIGWSPASVRRVQARYAKTGIECFIARATGGRKRANISFEREKQILAKFARQTRRGSALNVQEIRQAYERSVGRPVSPSTIYRLIHRHGLRRFLPRAKEFHNETSVRSDRNQSQNEGNDA
jgi:transposase